MLEIIEKLFNNQEDSIKGHNMKLIPNIDKETIIGVRFKHIETLAKENFNTLSGEKFLKHLPHKYFEENLLHAKLINKEKNFSELIEKINLFLPHVDNWAVCDSISPKAFEKNTEHLLAFLEKWMNVSDWHTRFCLNILMKHFLGDRFSEDILSFAMSANSGAYYVDMGLAWFMSYALIFNYEEVRDVVKKKMLPPFVHRKTIQKAIESYRIPDERKEYLRGLR